MKGEKRPKNSQRMSRLAFINFVEISYVFGSARLNPKRKDVIQKQWLHLKICKQVREYKYA